MSAAKTASRMRSLGIGLMAALASVSAWAGEPERWQLNMPEGVTATAHGAYSMHMIMLWICVVIGIIVFGAMAYAMFAFRKSKGAKPDVDFTHSTTLEIIWTVIPIVILVVMAWPATVRVIKQYNLDAGRKPHEMTVKVTGYQWMWRYEYVGEDVNFISRLDRQSDRMRQDRNTSQADIVAHSTYLRDVDRPLVIPADTRVRFVITADDVIHAWWVPDLGWKQDAIPGMINEGWTEVAQPGVYRGVCAELCGKDHGFMPIVVQVLPKAEYQSWLAAQKAGDLVEAARIAAHALPAAGAAGGAD